jgi:uncharacterized protein (TIGR03083 family)
MSPATDSYWSTVRSQRIGLADQVGGLDSAAWDSPSWCDGWRVRDVLGHLVHLAEASQLSMGLDMLRNGGLTNRALSRCACRLGALPVPDLADRLRAAANGRFHVAGVARTIVLGELAAHGSDMLRPLSLDVAVPPAELTPVLDTYVRFGRVAFGRKDRGAFGRGQVCLVATDCGWRHGHGDELRGRAIDLLLLLANRRQVLPELSGPGLDHLT